MGTTSSKSKELGLDPRLFRPEGGESWIDVNNRVHSFLEDVIYNHIKIGIINDGGSGGTGEARDEDDEEEEEKGSEGTTTGAQGLPKILCVTHGGLITEMLNVLDELEGKLPIQKDKVKNCAIYVFKVEDGHNGKIKLQSLIANDDSHLNE